MAGRRILLTGGNGFIGRCLLDSELARRHQVLAPSSRELDLTDTAAVDAWFKSNPVDVVVHSAVKPGHRNAKDPHGLLQANLRMFFNLERHKGSVERIIVLGSGAAYGAEHYRPRMAEGYFGEHVPGDEHGFTKYVCGRSMERSGNLLDLRLFGVFGPHEDYAIRFISNLMAKALHGLPLTMKQDRRFDFLWAPDLVPVLLHFIEQAPRHWDYNVTPDETVSLLDLAGRIRELSGRDLPIRVAQPGLGTEYSGDNARLKAELPGFRPTPFAESLPQLYRWYQQGLANLDRELLLDDK